MGPAPGVLYAGPGVRLVAYLIDAVILAVVTGLAAMVLMGTTVLAMASDRPGSFLALFALLPLLVLGLNGIQAAYFAVSWYRGGASPGMRIAGVRVVRSLDGGPLTKQQAVLRAIGYWVSGAVMYLGFIWILIDDRRQGWHDKIADTVVIQA